VTTFAVVAASAGADLSAGIVLILGISNMLADGFSMGVGSFLSSKAEVEQKNLDLSKPDAKDPKANGLITFASFCLLASIPITPYLWAFVTKSEIEHTFALACVFTAIAFMIIGWLQGYVNHTKKIKAILETLSYRSHQPLARSMDGTSDLASRWNHWRDEYCSWLQKTGRWKVFQN